MSVKVVCSQIARLWCQALREDQPLKDWAADRLGKTLSIYGGESPKRLKSVDDAPFIVVDVMHGQHGTRMEDYPFALRVGMGVAIDEADVSPDAVADAFSLLDSEFAEQIKEVLAAVHPDLEFVHVEYVYEDAFDPLFCLDLEITVLVPKTVATDIILNP